MIKKAIIVTVGFGMIAVGVTGISTSIVEHRNQVAAAKVEMMKQEALTATAEKEKLVADQKKEVEKLAANVEAEKQRLVQDRRKADEYYRSREAAVREKAASVKAVPKPNQMASKHADRKTAISRSHSGQVARHTVRNVRRPEPPAPRDRREGTKPMIARSGATDASKTDMGRVSKKAGLEAARSREAVKYLNRITHETVLAEPVGRDAKGSARVRLRVWRDDTLLRDSTVTFSAFQINGQLASR